MTAVADEHSVSYPSVRLHYSETCRWTTEMMNVSSGSRLCGNAIEFPIIARLGACFTRC